ncbi:MAG: RloB family protein, partial [Sulfurimonadaceae bacterium]
TQDSFVIANHNHSNPGGVLEDLKKHTCDNGKTYKDFEHKWIVIDRDAARVNGGGHCREDFNKALQSAKKLKVEVAYSNDSFELWYFAHFAYRSTAILRDDIVKEVIHHLKNKDPHKFTKLNKDNIKQENFTKLIFAELLELQETAIKNVKRLLTSYGAEHNPESGNPSTTVHLLVGVLNKLRERKLKE